VTVHSAPTLRLGPRLTLLAALITFAFVEVGSGLRAGAAPSIASVQHTCQIVDAALADGPDPNVDPVGYALAQVLPLRRVTTSDDSLKKSIDQLSSAFESYYKDKGSSAAKSDIVRAEKSINTFCPGAVS
jgi:hypothetical protein